MHLSRESEYGLKAMIYLAQQPPATILTLNQIAESRDLPAGFLSKTFQKLMRHGLVQSFRGRRRGYCLAREPSEILLGDLLEAIEGPDLIQRCIFWGDRCGNDNACTLHEAWGMVKPQFVELIQQRTLEDLAQGRAWKRPAKHQRR